MEFSENRDGRIYTAARLSSDVVASRLALLADGYDDVNQLVLERIELNTEVLRALGLALSSEKHSWIYLKFVDCRLAPGLQQQDANDNHSDAGEEASEIIEGLRFPPRVDMQTTPAFPANIAPFFPLGCIGRIESLRICTDRFTEPMAFRLGGAISKTETLERFSLSGSRFRGATQVLPLLTQGLRCNKSIWRLNLGDCQLGDSKAVPFIEAMKGHDNLRELDLSGNQFRDATMEALANELFPHAKNLQFLELGLQRHRLKLSILAPAIAANTSLKNLSLGNSQLVDEDIVALSDALCENRSIETLNLYNNRQVTDDGLVYLASKLPCLSIRNLNIRKTKPPTGSLAVMKALREGMQENTKIMLLRSVFWKYVQHGRHVQYLVNANRGGRRALEENLNPALWPLVFERANNKMYYCPLPQHANADAVYHLFRNAPMLWER